jgi:hypothetical protein
MLAVHQPAERAQARVRLVELTDAGDTLRLKPAAK